MSDLLVNKNLSQEEFTRQFKKEIKKEESFKFNAAGMQKLREDYAENYNSSVQLKNTLHDNLGIEDITIAYQDMSLEQLQEEGGSGARSKRFLHPT